MRQRWIHFAVALGMILAVAWLNPEVQANAKVCPRTSTRVSVYVPTHGSGNTTAMNVQLAGSSDRCPMDCPLKGRLVRPRPHAILAQLTGQAARQNGPPAAKTANRPLAALLLGELPDPHPLLDPTVDGSVPLFTPTWDIAPSRHASGDETQPQETSALQETRR